MNPQSRKGLATCLAESCVFHLPCCARGKMIEALGGPRLRPECPRKRNPGRVLLRQLVCLSFSSTHATARALALGRLSEGLVSTGPYSTPRTCSGLDSSHQTWVASRLHMWYSCAPRPSNSCLHHLLKRLENHLHRVGAVKELVARIAGTNEVQGWPSLKEQ
jgi:hypothetical protein